MAASVDSFNGCRQVSSSIASTTINPNRRAWAGLADRLADLEQLKGALRDRLDALGPAPRAELLHVLRLPDFDRADRIGEFWRHPETRSCGELLIDLEELLERALPHAKSQGAPRA